MSDPNETPLTVHEEAEVEAGLWMMKEAVDVYRASKLPVDTLHRIKEAGLQQPDNRRRLWEVLDLRISLSQAMTRLDDAIARIGNPAPKKVSTDRETARSAESDGLISPRTTTIETIVIPLSRARALRLANAIVATEGLGIPPSPELVMFREDILSSL